MFKALKLAVIKIYQSRFGLRSRFICPWLLIIKVIWSYTVILYLIFLPSMFSLCLHTYLACITTELWLCPLCFKPFDLSCLKIVAF